MGGRVANAPAESLSEREIEVLRLIADGLSNGDIAARLFLAPETVKWYNKQIFGKLDVHSRTQAVARATELGLLGGLDPLAAAALSPSAPAPPEPLPKNNLPAAVTSFVGRSQELVEVVRLLEQARLLTLTGPGGSGKTRLALQAAAHMLPRFADGAYFVPLASLPAADGVLWTVADALDFSFDGRGEPAAQLFAYLRPKRLLLVLDNFDHLLDAGALLVELLAAAPGVQALVTSRERLGVYGESVYALGGLALAAEGANGSAAQAEAVELFVQRARAVQPGLEWGADELRHIAAICRLVEGMPLAIELAAAWVDTLFPQEIAGELQRNLELLERGGPAGGQSMRAAFSRSWTLLDETQRAALRRLTLFRGGFTRAAAQAVAGVELRTLQALVGKSLLRRDPHSGRYDLHELLRHFAAEQLALSGEVGAVQQAHAAYYADFMAERWPWLKDRRQKDALAEMEADLDNARAACRTMIGARDAAGLAKFLHSFWAIYDVRGWHPAALKIFERAAQAMAAAGTDEARACLGWLLAVQGLFRVPVRSYDDAAPFVPAKSMAAFGVYAHGAVGPQEGYDLARQGVDILAALGRRDEMMIVPLISLFTTASQVDGKEAEARQAAQECLAIATALDDTWAIAKGKQFLAIQAIEEGDYAEGERLARDALLAFQQNGDNWSASVVCIEVLGYLAITRHEHDRAVEWIERGLAAAREIDFKYSIQTAYWQLGFVAALEGRYAESGKYWQAALAVSERMLGSKSFIGFVRTLGAGQSRRSPAGE